MGRVEVVRFLTHLAVGRSVAPFTQLQALSAILFMSENVLNIRVGGLNMSPTHGSGCRWSATSSVRCGRASTVSLGARSTALPQGLRITQVDFGCRQLMIRHGKGGQNLMAGLLDTLDTQVPRIGLIHERDLERGFGALH